MSINSQTKPSSATDRALKAIGGNFIQVGTENPTVVPTYATEGTLYIMTTINGVGVSALYQKQDNGATTNWTLVGGGGGSNAYVPTVPTDWKLPLPLTNQAALDQAASFINLKSANYVYADAVAGSDTDGTGSILRPYQTIQAAMAEIAAAPAGNYVLKLNPGSYGGAPVAIPGQVGKNVSIEGTGSGVEISAPLSFTPVAGFDGNLVVSNVGVQNLFDFDLSLASVAFVILTNGAYNPNRIDTLPPGPQFVKVQNSTVGYFQTNSVIQFANCNFVGGPNSVIGPTGNTIMLGTIFSYMQADVAGNIAFIGCLTDGTQLNDVGGTGVLSTDASSFQNVISFLPGFNYFDKAQVVGYTPDEPSDWSSPPDQVAEALDELAARPIATPETVFVYKEGASNNGNIYGTWADLYLALNNVLGPKTVYFDDSVTSPCVIPPGNYDLSQVTFDNATYGEQVQVQVADGVTWIGLVAINNIAIEFLTSIIVESLNQRAMFFEGTTIVNNGSSPIWNTPTGAQFQIFKGVVLTGNPGAPILEISSGQSFQLVANQFSNANSDAISGDATTTLQVFHADESSGVVLPQTNFAGTLGVVLLTTATKLAYAPSTPLDWSPAPDDVAEALDQLAARPIGGGSTPEKDKFVLTAPDIANGYLDLSQIAIHKSVNVLLEGATPLLEGATEDYTLSDALVTRVTFSAGVIAGLVVGQKVQVMFLY